MSRLVRVAMLSSLHPPFDTRIFQKEARTLAAAGYDVVSIAPHDRVEVVDSVRVQPFPRPGPRPWRVFASPVRMLREALRAGADIYHFHDPELIPVGLALKALGRKVVYDAHEDLPKSILGRTYLPRPFRRPLAWLVNLIEKASSRAFDLVVVAGEGIRSAFRHHPRVVVIRNYPRLGRFAEAPRERRGGGEFVVAYTGVLTAGRGAVEMVAAVGRLPERLRPRLVVLGKYWPQALEDAVRGMPEFRRVDYRGWVPHEQVPEALAGADVGLVCFLPEPNHIEAGPNKLFEYMAAGLPVVASDFPAWREIVEGGDCGLCVDPTDVAGIAAALEELAGDPERRARMGENGRRAVLERYNWDAEGRRLVEVYSTLR